ncbi:MAG: uracil-DNA glycosylase [Chitinispirillales bacterium]|jgi:DNA polymerase|nr:uracil-DNA glycosylase [Chitinispirillales bacterium]
MSKDELEQIAVELKDCFACNLSKGRKNAVAGNGDGNAKIMIVGESPGKEEDEQGKPFVGDAGETLDELLAGIGIKRKDCYVTNRVKCNPLGENKPKQKELDACQKYLDKEIEIIKPSVILLVGETAAKLASPEKMENIHGKEFSYKNIPAFVVYHPSGLNNKNKDEREEDFRKFGELVKNLEIEN